MNDLENKILVGIEAAISEAIIKQLVGYQSPINDLVKSVFNENYDAIYKLINSEFESLLNEPVFKDELKKALNQKLAKILISRMGGELEKQVNQLKSNPETRARIMCAISEIVAT